MERPSGFLTLLIRVAADPDSRDAVLADLDEEFEERAREAGSRATRRWYRAQVLRSVAPLLSYPT